MYMKQDRQCYCVFDYLLYWTRMFPLSVLYFLPGPNSGDPSTQDSCREPDSSDQQCHGVGH